MELVYYVVLTIVIFEAYLLVKSQKWKQVCIMACLLMGSLSMFIYAYTLKRPPLPDDLSDGWFMLPALSILLVHIIFICMYHFNRFKREKGLLIIASFYGFCSLIFLLEVLKDIFLYGVIEGALPWFGFFALFLVLAFGLVHKKLWGMVINLLYLNCILTTGIKDLLNIRQDFDYLDICIIIGILLADWYILKTYRINVCRFLKEKKKTG